jgi:phosphatidate cytidylyltransferase
MSHNLPRRIAVAAVLIPAVFGLVYAGDVWLAGGLALVGALGTKEVFDLAARRGINALRPAGYVGALALPFVVLMMLQSEGTIRPTVIAGGGALWIVAVMLSALATRGPDKGPLAAVAVTVFGVVYAAGLPTALLGLRYTPLTAGDPLTAAWLAFLPLVLTWTCDTAAMLGGVTIGGRKLAPVASPNKTWAGGVAGVLAACVAAPFYGMYLLGGLQSGPAAWQLVIVGAVVGVFGQLGDIAESLLKREAGVKDSGAILPGHGGILDRLDSLYWVLPLSLLTLKLLRIL